jgi:hypothetical protein
MEISPRRDVFLMFWEQRAIKFLFLLFSVIFLRLHEERNECGEKENTNANEQVNDNS